MRELGEEFGLLVGLKMNIAFGKSCIEATEGSDSSNLTRDISVSNRTLNDDTTYELSLGLLWDGVDCTCRHGDEWEEKEE